MWIYASFDGGYRITKTCDSVDTQASRWHCRLRVKSGWHVIVEGPTSFVFQQKSTHSHIKKWRSSPPHTHTHTTITTRTTTLLADNLFCIGSVWQCVSLNYYIYKTISHNHFTIYVALHIITIISSFNFSTTHILLHCIFLALCNVYYMYLQYTIFIILCTVPMYYAIFMAHTWHYSYHTVFVALCIIHNIPSL